MAESKENLKIYPLRDWSELFGDATKGASFKSARGLNLSVRRYLPAQAPKGIVFFVHGYFDLTVSPGVDAFARLLNDNGFALFGVDQEGHGESEGLRGYLNMEDAVRNILELVSRTQKDYPNLPYCLVGHSMGGMLTIATGLHLSEHNNPLFKGAVLMCPALAYPDAPPALAVNFLRYCLLPCCPSWQCLCIPSPGFEIAFKDKESIEMYAKNPYLIELHVRLGTGDSFMRMMDHVNARAPDVKFPFLMVQGTDDKVVDAKAIPTWAKRTSTPEKDKTVFMMEGAYHDVFHDSCRNQATPVILDFIKQRLSH